MSENERRKRETMPRVWRTRIYQCYGFHKRAKRSVERFGERLRRSSAIQKAAEAATRPQNGRNKRTEWGNLTPATRDSQGYRLNMQALTKIGVVWSGVRAKRRTGGMPLVRQNRELVRTR